MRTAEVILEYQPYIDFVPKSPKQLHAEACQNDEVTINSWREIWKKNVKMNHEKYGPFKDRSISKFFDYAKHKPVIIAGAGPSLKHNVTDLSERKEITFISCLHNYHLLEDKGCPADFYVTLDAGDVTIEEVYEGGSKTPDEYWESTKNKKLLAYIGTSPRLLEKWKGDIYFFTAPVPDEEYVKFCDDLEKFESYVSNGGNVLGACLYIAKAYMGASIIGYIGADFCFSYDKKFHAWDSKYDSKLGHVLRVKDIFGNSVYTWQSYHNFKGWFEYIAMTVPGVYYNCSEGGTFGAYLEGNIRAVVQLPLKDFIRQMNIYEEIKIQKQGETKLLF